MTQPRDPDALLSAYLLEGMEVLPDRVVDSVLDEAHRTRQRAGFGLSRNRPMYRSALGAAAVVAAAILGGAILVFVSGRQTAIPPDPTAAPTFGASQPAVIGPSTSATASPTPGPSTTPTPSAVTDPTGTWMPTGTMGTPRSGPTAVRLLDGRVLVVGGSVGDEPDQALTSAEIYDPTTGTWSATGNMIRPHEGFRATLLSDGRVLVGDVNDPAADNAVSGAEVYDPATGRWTVTGKMVHGGGGESTATLLRDGTVLVVGYSDTGELFDPDSGTWTATGMMIDPRHSHVAMLLPDGKVLVAGGHAPGDQPTDSAELYDPDTRTWTAIAKMQAPLEAIEAFLTSDGKVLVVGGSARGAPQSAETYDPATGSWIAAPEKSRPGMLVNASTTLLSDGRVLVTDSGIESAGSDLYDPSTGSWTSAAPMLRPHETPAILLLDGTVLVAGGRDCLDGVCVATGSAELYVPRGVSPPPLPAFPTPPPPVFPTPTPRPSPYPPQAGVVPSGARTWTVTVANKSSGPATLFAAEEGEGGLGPACGTVTPSVVPPDTTMDVTFLLPPKRVKDCWIWLNPVPGEGGSMFQTSDAPMNGEFVVTEDGQQGWLGR